MYICGMLWFHGRILLNLGVLLDMYLGVLLCEYLIDSIYKIPF